MFMIREITDLQNYHSKNEYSEFIRQYFLWILLYGTSKYIKNIDVEIKILEVWETLIPISFWNNKRNNCYVWSILGSIDYALYEYKKSTNFFFYVCIFFFIFPITFLLRKFNIEDTVYVSNLLLSTNLLPDLKEKELEEIHTYLILRYPWKCIIYRSINTVNHSIYEWFFKQNWYRSICFRQVFMFFKDRTDIYFWNKSVKEDKRLLERKAFSQIKLSNPSKKELESIKECYDELYLKKYTYYNPQFSLKFFEWVIQNNLFQVNILSHKDSILAVYGYYTLEKQSTTPIFGFLPDKNIELWLYRQISYLTLKDTLVNSEYLNHSSWAWYFKTHRWAEKVLEYSYVYSEHLVFSKRAMWKFLSFISRIFIEPKLNNNLY